MNWLSERSPGLWWCHSHGREATDVRSDGERRCNPRLGGIMLPCHVEHLEVVPADEIEELVRLRQWVADLQSGMYVNCVYCGHRYGPVESTPVVQANVLKAHIAQCPEHPLGVLVAGIEKLVTDTRKQLDGGLLVTPGDMLLALAQLQLAAKKV